MASEDAHYRSYRESGLGWPAWIPGDVTDGLTQRSLEVNAIYRFFGKNGTYLKLCGYTFGSNHKSKVQSAFIRPFPVLQPRAWSRNA